MSSEAMPLPAAEPTAQKVYPEKISTIVDQIAQLNLLEVADLNELLKVSIINFSSLKNFKGKVTYPLLKFCPICGLSFLKN